eukprot:TRINITY_DN165_c2_g1_i6.p1 TRINITY_DN165_c2_g1~~TRINITY_DN165_c2_g1_i6.p1  ORF type:complete len:1410 (+),score=333.89 TRINITY_DN165_c2_g1_i6:108-4337(+)
MSQTISNIPIIPLEGYDNLSADEKNQRFADTFGFRPFSFRDDYTFGATIPEDAFDDECESRTLTYYCRFPFQPKSQRAALSEVDFIIQNGYSQLDVAIAVRHSGGNIPSLSSAFSRTRKPQNAKLIGPCALWAIKDGSQIKYGQTWRQISDATTLKQYLCFFSVFFRFGIGKRGFPLKSQQENLYRNLASGDNSDSLFRLIVKYVLSSTSMQGFINKKPSERRRRDDDGDYLAFGDFCHFFRFLAFSVLRNFQQIGMKFTRERKGNEAADTEAIDGSWTEESLKKLWMSVDLGGDPTQPFVDQTLELKERLEAWNQLVFREFGSAAIDPYFDDALFTAANDLYVFGASGSLLDLTKKAMESKELIKFDRDVILSVNRENTLTGCVLFLFLAFEGKNNFHNEVLRMVDEGGVEAAELIRDTMREYIQAVLAQKNGVTKDWVQDRLNDLHKKNPQNDVLTDLVRECKKQLRKKLSLFWTEQSCRTLKRIGFDFEDRDVSHGIFISSKKHVPLEDADWDLALNNNKLYARQCIDYLNEQHITNDYSPADHSYHTSFYHLRTCEKGLQLHARANNIKSTLATKLATVSSFLLHETQCYTSYVVECMKLLNGGTPLDSYEDISRLLGLSFPLLVGQNACKYVSKNGFRIHVNNGFISVTERGNRWRSNVLAEAAQGNKKYAAALEVSFKQRAIQVQDKFLRVMSEAYCNHYEIEQPNVRKKQLAVIRRHVFGCLDEIEVTDENGNNGGGDDVLDAFETLALDDADEDFVPDVEDLDEDDMELEDMASTVEELAEVGKMVDLPWVHDAKQFVGSFWTTGSPLTALFNLMIRTQIISEDLSITNRFRRIVPEFRGSQCATLFLTQQLLSSMWTSVVEEWKGTNQQRLRFWDDVVQICSGANIEAESNDKVQQQKVISIVKNLLYIDMIATTGKRWDDIFTSSDQEYLDFAANHDVSGLPCERVVFVGNRQIESIRQLLVWLGQEEPEGDEQWTRLQPNPRSKVLKWLQTFDSTPLPLHLLLVVDNLDTAFPKNDIVRWHGVTITGTMDNIRPVLYRRESERKVHRLYSKENEGVDLRSAFEDDREARVHAVLARNAIRIQERSNLKPGYTTPHIVDFRMVAQGVISIDGLIHCPELQKTIDKLAWDLDVLKGLDNGPLTLGNGGQSQRARPLAPPLPFVNDTRTLNRWLAWLNKEFKTEKEAKNVLGQMPSIHRWQNEIESAIEILRNCGLAGDDPGACVALIHFLLNKGHLKMEWNHQMKRIEILFGSWEKLDVKMTAFYKRKTGEAKMIKDKTEWINSVSGDENYDAMTEQYSYEELTKRRNTLAAKLNQKQTEKLAFASQQHKVNKKKKKLDDINLRAVQKPKKTLLYSKRKDKLEEAAASMMFEENQQDALDDKKLDQLSKIMKKEKLKKEL